MNCRSRAALMPVLALALAACGGGGGGINPTAAAVTSFSVGAAQVGQPLLITLEGRNLDKPVSVSASGCLGLALSSTEPHASTATTAYYQCTPYLAGALQFTAVRSSDSVLMATVPFTVPVPQVTLTVSNGAGVGGDVMITLEPNKTPQTVLNFLSYVNAGFYVDTVFHRVIPGFIVQGGGYARSLVPGGTVPDLKATNAPIPLEDNAGLSNLKGTIAMARSNVLNSATSQFFINLKDNTDLDSTATARGYAVFGSVSAGADVVAAMGTAPCSAWVEFFGSGDDPTVCLPTPNLVVTAASQTR